MVFASSQYNRDSYPSDVVTLLTPSFKFDGIIREPSEMVSIVDETVHILSGVDKETREKALAHHGEKRSTCLTWTAVSCAGVGTAVLLTSASVVNPPAGIVIGGVSAGAAIASIIGAYQASSAVYAWTHPAKRLAFARTEVPHKLFKDLRPNWVMKAVAKEEMEWKCRREINDFKITLEELEEGNSKKTSDTILEFINVLDPQLCKEVSKEGDKLSRKMSKVIRVRDSINNDKKNEIVAINNDADRQITNANKLTINEFVVANYDLNNLNSVINAIRNAEDWYNYAINNLRARISAETNVHAREHLIQGYDALIYRKDHDLQVLNERRNYLQEVHGYNEGLVEGRKNAEVKGIESRKIERIREVSKRYEQVILNKLMTRIRNLPS